MSERFEVHSEQMRGERRVYWIVDRQIADRFVFTRRYPGMVSATLSTNKKRVYTKCARMNQAQP